MKLNLKKLGAVIAGAAILASSVAFAGLYYGNTELVNDNGQVVTKVVVGQNAAVSDAVAAANIASAIASNAYKDVELTAQVTGEAACSSGEVTGECEITDKTVTLEVTVPGLESTAMHQFGLLIAEDADRDLGDREMDTSNVYTDLLDEEAAFWADQDGNEITTSNPFSTSEVTYMIGEKKFAPFETFSVKTSTSAEIGKEYQRIYVIGGTRYSTSEDTVYFGKNANGDVGVVYALLFGPDDKGIKLCPGDEGKTLGACASEDLLSGKRYQVKFLGSNWVISDIKWSGQLAEDNESNSEWMTKDDVAMPKDVGGFELKLAKEASYGILNIGDCLEIGNVKVCLDDISRETGHENVHPAIISYYDLEDNLLGQDQINPGETEELDVGGGETVKVHVYQTAPGYTLGAKWAEMAILDHEIPLKHGEKFLEDESDEESDWTVYFGLTGETSMGNVSEATHLKEILFVASDDAFDAVNEDVTGLEEGDSLPILDLEGYQAFELKNLGLSDAEFDTLKMQYVDGSKDFKLYRPSDDAYLSTITSTAYVKITSTLEKAFRDDQSHRERELYFVWRDNGNGVVGSYELFVLLKREDGGYYCEGENGPGICNPFSEKNFEYRFAGSNYGQITIKSDSTIKFREDVEEIDNVETWDQLGIKVDFANDKMVGINDHKEDGTTFIYLDSLRNLSNFGYRNNTDYEADFITLRGTRITDADDDIRTYKVPNELRKVQMLLKPTSAATESVNSQEVGPLREGDVATVGDVTIKVTKIDVEATATCSASAEGGATADMSGVSAVISDGSQTYTTFQAAVPSQAIDLVVLDSQAPDTGTVVTVGGPAVNSVTASVLEGSDVELSPENPVVVKEVGGKIVVAGWTAEDTVSAAQQFIAALQRQ